MARIKLFKNAARYAAKDGSPIYPGMVSGLSGQSPEAVRELSEEVSASVRAGVRNSIRGQSWTWKAARNAGYTNPRIWIQWITPFIGAVLTGAMIIQGVTVKEFFQITLSTIILFLACNPFRMIGRWLAIESRWMIIADMILILLSLDHGWKVIGAAAVWTIIVAMFVFFLNRQWLNTYNWLNSESVRKALVQAPDNKGVVSWDEYGKRETRTVLAETGLEFDDDVLVMYGKPIWICGFYGAWRSVAAEQSRVERAQDEVRISNLQIEKLNQEINNLKDKIRDYEKETTRLRRFESQVLVAERKEKEATEKAEILREENESLRKANETLLVESAAVEETEEESIESKVIRLRFDNVDEKGNSIYSYQKISELLDNKIGKTKVYEICKKHMEETNGKAG